MLGGRPRSVEIAMLGLRAVVEVARRRRLLCSPSPRLIMESARRGIIAQLGASCQSNVRKAPSPAQLACWPRARARRVPLASTATKRASSRRQNNARPGSIVYQALRILSQQMGRRARPAQLGIIARQVPLQKSRVLRAATSRAKALRNARPALLGIIVQSARQRPSSARLKNTVPLAPMRGRTAQPGRIILIN